MADVFDYNAAAIEYNGKFLKGSKGMLPGGGLLFGLMLTDVVYAYFYGV
jgi:hypothetical protein